MDARELNSSDVGERPGDILVLLEHLVDVLPEQGSSNGKKYDVCAVEEGHDGTKCRNLGVLGLKREDWCESKHSISE